MLNDDYSPEAMKARRDEVDDRWRRTLVRRPSGAALLIASAIVLPCAAMALVVGVANPDLAFLVWPASATISFGIGLWLTGRIERALFFLPGRDVTNGDIVPK